MSFLAAFKFLTAIPVPGRATGGEDLGRSIAYFPVVGLVIGLMLAGLNWLGGYLFPEVIVNGLLLVALVLITGAMHLDGFIDTCDGIAGHKSVEERWRVMRDSRVGAFGVIGVILLLLVKYISLNSLGGTLMMATLVLMPTVSRWAMAYAVKAYPYARPEGLGRILKQGASWPGLVAATAITLMAAIGLAWLAGITCFYLVGPAIMLGVWVVTVGLAAYLKSKFAGLTGDSYGAINEVAEVFVLLLVALLSHNQWLQFVS